MKKKLIMGLISFISISASAMLIAGCDNTTHSHTFNEQVTQVEYLKSNANCTQKAVYYYSCTCGEIGTTTFEFGEINPDNHIFNKQTASTKYLKSEATCTNKAEYYYSCACGEIGTQTFKYGQANGHSFKTYTTKDIATCISDETQIATCENCTSTDIKTIAGTQLPHNFQNAICTGCKDSYLKLSLTANNTYTVNGLKSEYSNLEEIVIPANYNGVAVTSIADSAFIDCNNLTKIIISEGISVIGREAFKNSHSITSVTIPSTISEIDSYAFNGCYRLVEIYNLSSLDITSGSSSNGNIGLYAIDIYSDTSIISKVIKNNDYIFYIGDKNYLIDYKGNSDTIVLPDNYNQQTYEIKDYAFYNKSALTQVTVPNSVTRIGYSAFAGCNKLNNLSIPFVGENPNNKENSYLGYIFGADVNYNSDKYVPASLTKITVKGETAIQDNAFAYCKDIETVVIENGVTKIGAYAFDRCSKLKSVTISDSVLSIGTYAFVYCYALENISLPDSLIAIGNSVFNDTLLFKNEKNWVDDVLYLNNYLIKAKSNLTGKYTIKANTKVIAESAFSSCNNLTEVVIPNTVISIGKSAFSGCSKLSTASIPLGIKEIPAYLFNGCKELSSVDLPISVTSIGDSAFSGCSNLLTINLPIGLIDIGESIFNECTKLHSITIPQNVASIPASMFYGCSALESVVLSNKITTIGSVAFYGCSSLTNITIPSSVIEIGFAAFYGCSNLSNATFEITSGWILSAMEPSSAKIELSASDVSNSSKAAQYLASGTYYMFIWRRS